MRPGTGGVVLDALRCDDAERCAELERRLFGGDDPWSAAAFRGELHAGHHYLAARLATASADGGDGVPGRLVGYAGLALMPAPPMSPADPEAEVHTIGVDPDHQDHGIGRRLLRGLLEVADAAGAVVFLEVRTDNAAALGLYRSEGFEVVGTRRRYYASGADAHTMRRERRSPG